MEENKQKIESLLEQATEIASNWLKNHLKKMLKDNPKKIDEIINRMGTTAFYKKGEPLWTHECEELKGYAELSDFLSEYDDILHLTGIDMTFKRAFS